MNFFGSILGGNNTFSPSNSGEITKERKDDIIELIEALSLFQILKPSSSSFAYETVVDSLPSKVTVKPEMEWTSLSSSSSSGAIEEEDKDDDEYYIMSQMEEEDDSCSLKNHSSTMDSTCSIPCEVIQSIDIAMEENIDYFIDDAKVTLDLHDSSQCQTDTTSIVSHKKHPENHDYEDSNLLSCTTNFIITGWLSMSNDDDELSECILDQMKFHKRFQLPQKLEAVKHWINNTDYMKSCYQSSLPCIYRDDDDDDTYDVVNVKNVYPNLLSKIPTMDEGQGHDGINDFLLSSRMEVANHDFHPNVMIKSKEVFFPNVESRNDTYDSSFVPITCKDLLSCKSAFGISGWFPDSDKEECVVDRIRIQDEVFHIRLEESNRFLCESHEFASNASSLPISAITKTWPCCTCDLDSNSYNQETWRCVNLEENLEPSMMIQNSLLEMNVSKLEYNGERQEKSLIADAEISCTVKSLVSGWYPESDDEECLLDQDLQYNNANMRILESEIRDCHNLDNISQCNLSSKIQIKSEFIDEISNEFPSWSTPNENNQNLQESMIQKEHIDNPIIALDDDFKSDIHSSVFKKYNPSHSSEIQTSEAAVTKGLESDTVADASYTHEEISFDFCDVTNGDQDGGPVTFQCKVNGSFMSSTLSFEITVSNNNVLSFTVRHSDPNMVISDNNFDMTLETKESYLEKSIPCEDCLGKDTVSFFEDSTKSSTHENRSFVIDWPLNSNDFDRTQNEFPPLNSDIPNPDVISRYSDSMNCSQSKDSNVTPLFQPKEDIFISSLQPDDFDSTQVSYPNIEKLEAPIIDCDAVEVSQSTACHSIPLSKDIYIASFQLLNLLGNENVNLSRPIDCGSLKLNPCIHSHVNEDDKVGNIGNNVPLMYSCDMTSCADVKQIEMKDIPNYHTYAPTKGCCYDEMSSGVEVSKEFLTGNVRATQGISLVMTMMTLSMIWGMTIPHWILRVSLGSL